MNALRSPSDRTLKVFTALFLFLLTCNFRADFLTSKARWADFSFLLLLVYVIFLFFKEKYAVGRPLFFTSLLALFAAGSVSLFAAVDFHEGFVQWIGFFYLITMYLFLEQLFRFRKESLLFLMKTWVWINGGMAFLSLISFLFPNFLWLNSFKVVFDSYPNLRTFARLKGLSHNPNAFALDLNFAAIFSLWLWCESFRDGSSYLTNLPKVTEEPSLRRGLCWLITFFILMAALFLTVSRTLSVTLLSAWLLMMGYTLTRFWTKTLRTLLFLGWIFFLPLMTALTIWSVMPLRVERQGVHLSVDWNRSWCIYFELGRAGLEMFQNHPLIGVGLGNFPRHLGDYMDRHPMDPDHIYSTEETRREFMPHNFYLGWLAETGTPGLIGFLMFFGAITKRLWGMRRRGEMRSAHLFWCLWVGLMVLGWMGNFMFSRIFWIFLAMVASLNVGLEEQLKLGAGKV